jgi:carbamoyltransferase
MRAILDRWIREHQQPVLLIPLPLHQYVEGTADPGGYQARFRELAGATGCILHDPLHDLLQYSAAERRALRYEHDIHPSPQGHAALARSIAPAVARALTHQGNLARSQERAGLET